MRLAHISDTHFGTERAEVLAALVALLDGLDLDAIIWSGDITQRATDEQFRRARAFADRLPLVPLLVMPGNHDLPLWHLVERLLQPYQRFTRCFEGALEPVLDLPGLQVTAADTTRRWRQQHGALSQAQIDRVARRLRQAQRGCWRLVVTHHPLVVNQGQDLADRPWRHAQALRSWIDAGADALLGGHTHVPFVACQQAGGRTAWWLQAGSALSARLRQGHDNSINLLLDKGEQRRSCERWDYDESARRFGPVQRTVL